MANHKESKNREVPVLIEVKCKTGPFGIQGVTFEEAEPADKQVA